MHELLFVVVQRTPAAAVAPGAVVLQQAERGPLGKDFFEAVHHDDRLAGPLRRRRSRASHVVEIAVAVSLLPRLHALELDRNVGRLALARPKLYGRFRRLVVRLVNHHFISPGQCLWNRVVAFAGEYRVPQPPVQVVRADAESDHLALIGSDGASNRAANRGLCECHDA